MTTTRSAASSIVAQTGAMLGRLDGAMDPEATSDLPGALTALSLYLEAAERLARETDTSGRLQEALSGARQAFHVVVRLAMARSEIDSQDHDQT